MPVFEGFILTPSGFVEGRIGSDAAGRIDVLVGAAVDEARVRTGRAAIALPGFIDLHVHGGAGRDIMEGGDAALQVSRLHAAHGTTALLATTMTAPQEDLDAAFAALAPLCNRPAQGAARVLGVHLEGPYISAAKLGAQPAFVRAANMAEIRRLHALAPIRLLTLAPEVSNNQVLIADLVAMGMRVQLGHTTGSYEQGVAALRCGATGFTHLYNAMSRLDHRAPGMVGAALAHAKFSEIIPDLHYDILKGRARYVCESRLEGVINDEVQDSLLTGEFQDVFADARWQAKSIPRDRGKAMLWFKNTA